MGKLLPADRRFEIRAVNGWRALVWTNAGRIELVMNIETDGHPIFAIRSILNPDKLRLLRID